MLMLAGAGLLIFILSLCCEGICKVRGWRGVIIFAQCIAVYVEMNQMEVDDLMTESPLAIFIHCITMDSAVIMLVPRLLLTNSVY